MTKTKTKSFDCVDVKRKAQRSLTRALEGHSPAEQMEILRQLAEKSPFWRKLRDAKTKPPAKAKPSAKRKKSA